MSTTCRRSPFRFGDGFGIRWYGLAYLSGFVGGWLILRWMARTGPGLLRPEQVGDFMTWMVIGVSGRRPSRLRLLLFDRPSLDLLGVIPILGGS